MRKMTEEEATALYNERLNVLKHEYDIPDDTDNIKIKQPSTINFDPIYARWNYDLSERLFLYLVKHYEETVMFDIATKRLEPLPNF